MENIKEYVAKKKAELKDFFGSFARKKVLVIVQVNDDDGSNAYIRGKLKDCAEINVEAKLIKLPVTTSEEELLKLVDNLNKDIIDASRNIYMVGGKDKPTPNTTLISGTNRFDTMQAVLNYIKK